MYLNILGSLRDRCDVLIIDKRGTGTSDAIDYPGVQTDRRSQRSCHH